MKVALLTVGEEHQIMFEPETDTEKAIIGLLTGKNDINIHKGTYGNSDPMMFPQLCHGDYYRQFSKEGCAMIVITPKKEQINAKTM